MPLKQKRWERPSASNKSLWKSTNTIKVSQLVFLIIFRTLYGRFFMFFSIIPFSHSMGTEPLLYAWGDIWENTIWIGSIVEIPYGKNMENGIIAWIYRESPIDISSEAFARIKDINGIVTNRILLSPYQIDMICAISVKYMIPIHRVLAIFLTRPVVSRLEKKHYEQLIHIDSIEDDTLKKLQDENDEKIWWKIHIVQDNIVTPDLVENYINWPTIIILPDDFAIMPYQKYYTNREDILFVTTDMTDTKRAQAWIDITNGVFSIIYWTRKILYYNLSKYKNIIYIEDALGPDYWHYPIRINYNDILRIFMETNPSIWLTILTSVPTLTTFIHFKNFEIKNIKHPIRNQYSWKKI